jgi:hypothetical protein
MYVCVCVYIYIYIYRNILYIFSLSLHNQDIGAHQYVRVAPHGQPLSMRPASAKYIKVLGMHTVSRGDKVSFIRLMMQEETDQSLHAFLQDRLRDDQCDLAGLLNVLQEAD